MADNKIHNSKLMQDMAGGSTIPTQGIESTPLYKDIAGNTVDLMSPNNERYAIPLEKAHIALERGFRPLTPEEEKHFKNADKFGNNPISPVIAGIESGLETATLGLSDVILEKTRN